MPRLVGESRKLYVGRSADLAYRTGRIAAWEHSASERIDSLLGNDSYWQGAPQGERSLSIEARAVPDPELEEIRLLSHFLSEHLELPPLNRNSPGAIFYLVLKRVMDGIVGQLHQLKGLGPGSLQTHAAWDDVEGDHFSWANATYLGKVVMCIGWTWSKEDSEGARPDWWPEERMPFDHESLYLFVDPDWAPWGHARLRASTCWRRVGDDWGFLGLNKPISLPEEHLRRVPSKKTQTWSSGFLASGADLASDLGMSVALRRSWAHVDAKIADHVA